MWSRVAYPQGYHNFSDLCSAHSTPIGCDCRLCCNIRKRRFRGDLGPSPTLYRFDGAGWIGALCHSCCLANHICFFDCLVGSKAVKMGSWRCHAADGWSVRHVLLSCRVHCRPPGRCAACSLHLSVASAPSRRNGLLYNTVHPSSWMTFPDVQPWAGCGGHQHQGRPVTDTSGVPGPGRGRVVFAAPTRRGRDTADASKTKA